MLNQLNINGVVNASVEMNNKLYLAGTISSINGVGQSYFSVIDLSNGEVFTEDSISFDSTVNDMTDIGDNKIAIVGSFGTVSLNGVLTTGCEGIVVYDTVAKTMTNTGVTRVTGVDIYNPQSSRGWKVVYHSSTGTFYVCGGFVYSTPYSDEVTGIIGISKATGLPIPTRVFIKQRVGGVLSAYEVNDIVINGDILYMAPKIDDQSIGHSFDISTPNAGGVMSKESWDFYHSGSLDFIGYADGNVWFFSQSTGYKNPRSAWTTTSLGSAIVRTDSSGVITNTYNLIDDMDTTYPRRSSISGIESDGTDATVWGGGFIGIGDYTADYQRMGSYGKFNLSSGIRTGSVVEFGQKLYDNYKADYITSHFSVKTKLLHEGRLHLFGDMRFQDGYAITSHAILNEDGSKLQNAFILRA